MRLRSILINPLTWILLLATLLRCYDLGGESLWLDEGIAAQRILKDYSVQDDNWTQGPLYLVIIKFYASFAGMSEADLRFPSVIPGIAAVLYIFLLGSLLFNRSVGIVATLLLAVNPFAIHFSQDARPYSLFLMATLAAVYHAVRLSQNIARTDGILFAVFAASLVYVHPNAAFIYPALLIAYYLPRRAQVETFSTQELKKLALIAGATFVLALPQFVRVASKFLQKAEKGDVAAWIPAPTFSDLIRTITLYFNYEPLLIGTLLIAFIGFIFSFHKKSKDSTALVLLLVLGTASIVIPWIVSVAITPIYQHRYTIPGLGAVILIAAYGIVNFPRKARLIAYIVIACLSIVPLHYYYSYSEKEPWRQSVAYISEHAKSGETVYLVADFIKSPVLYYFGTQDSLAIVPLSKKDSLELKLVDAKSLWLIQSFVGNKSDFVVRIHEHLSVGRTLTQTIDMNDSIRSNPLNPIYATIELFHYETDSASP